MNNNELFNFLMQNNDQMQKDSQKTPATIKIKHKILNEYIRWIEYIPSLEVLKLDNIFQKKSTDLTKEESLYLLNHKNNLSILERLKACKKEDFTEYDVITVTNYINNNDLTSLIETKLTESELKEATELLKKANKLSIEELEVINQKNQQFTKGEMVSAIDSFYALKIKKLYEDKCFLMSTQKLDNMLKYQNIIDSPHLSRL